MARTTNPIESISLRAPARVEDARAFSAFMKFLGVLAINFAAAVPAFAGPGNPLIQTDDVALFYQLYDSADGHPTAEQLQHDYLDKGSKGLHVLAEVRNVTGERMADTLAKRPEIYADARRCASALPGVRARLSTSMQKLAEVYPEARFPPVTIAVGRGKPVGVGSPVTGVQIGLEALCATDFMNPDIEDRFVYVIAHEYVHVQQVQALVDADRPTVLEGSLIEGAADFIGELTSGGLSYAYLDALTRGREKAIETKFVPDMDKTDLSSWLYNSTPDKPSDLGYWVGYRIVKSFYQHAADKRQAIRDIIEMRDPKTFLAKSGWYPGIILERAP
jgi:hypothetical protein